MEGITVLTEATGWSGLDFFCLLFCIVVILGIFFSLIMLVCSYLDDKVTTATNSAVFAFLFIISLLISASIIFCIGNKIDEYNACYKITVDDSVSFSEFNAKYKVLKQDGRIFTVVEREVESSEKSERDITESQTNISE